MAFPTYEFGPKYFQGFLKAFQWKRFGAGVYQTGAQKPPVDYAFDNNFPLYGDNIAGTSAVQALKLTDTNNITQLSNPNGANAVAFSTTQVATPSAPVITNVGTAGATTYTYVVVGVSGNGSMAGTTAASASGSTTTGNATLSATNYNVVTMVGLAGAVSLRVYRTVGGATQGLIGTVTQLLDASGNIITPVLNDTGLAGDSSTAPTTNTTGVIAAGGPVTAGGVTIADGTGAVINSVYSVETTATLAQINAGTTFLAAVTGQTLKVVGVWMKFTGTFTTATDIRISDTAGSPVDVFTVAIAGATTGSVVDEGQTTNITLGTFAAALTASQGLQIRKTGSAAAAGTSVLVRVLYKINS